jgi:hypothetical protein
VIDLGRIGTRPVTTIMVLYAQDREVFINGVRGIPIDMEESASI